MEVREHVWSLSPKREQSKLHNENIPLYESYTDDKENKGEYLLKSLNGHNDIYKYVKDLAEKKERDWREEIAEFLGMADIIVNKLKEDFNAQIFESQWAWHYKTKNYNNNASPVESKITYTIEICSMLQEIELKIEAVNDFISFAEHACNYHDCDRPVSTYPKRMFRF